MKVGRSVVLSSMDPITGQIVAIKCIPIKHDEPLPESKEVEILEVVQSEHVIKFLDCFYYPAKNPRFLSIVMPRAITDLFYYLKDHGPLTESLCCRIMKQALHAVKHLHNNNIWHRDLKLENILVMKETPNGIDIAITGFGLADFFEGEIYTGTCVGTLQYAAPELLDDQELKFKPNAKYSNNIDIWSMGVVLYVLLSGVLPFEPDNEEDVRNLLNGNLDFDEENPESVFRNVTRECKDLIRQMLQADPNKRFSIDEVLEHEWFRMYENEHDFEGAFNRLNRLDQEDEELIRFM